MQCQPIFQFLIPHWFHILSKAIRQVNVFYETATNENHAAQHSNVDALQNIFQINFRGARIIKL